MMFNSMMKNKITMKELQKINRLEELEMYYYQIPEHVYDNIPIEYIIKEKFTLKKLLGIVISLYLFFGAIIELIIKSDFQLEKVCAAIPLIVIAVLIFSLTVSPHLHVEKDSQIIEAEVRKIERKNLFVLGHKYVVSLVTLYIPSLKREVIAHIEKTQEGKHIVIVKKKNYHFFVHMNFYYIPKYVYEDK